MVAAAEGRTRGTVVFRSQEPVPPPPPPPPTDAETARLREEVADLKLSLIHI